MYVERELISYVIISKDTFNKGEPCMVYLVLSILCAMCNARCLLLSFILGPMISLL